MCHYPLVKALKDSFPPVRGLKALCTIASDVLYVACPVITSGPESSSSLAYDGDVPFPLFCVSTRLELPCVVLPWLLPFVFTGTRAGLFDVDAAA